MVTEGATGAECMSTLKEFLAAAGAVWQSSKGGNKDPHRYDANDNYQQTLEIPLNEYGVPET